MSFSELYSAKFLDKSLKKVKFTLYIPKRYAEKKTVADIRFSDLISNSYKLDNRYFDMGWDKKSWDDIWDRDYALSTVTDVLTEELIAINLSRLIDVEQLNHILKIVVKKEHRSKGIGHSMLNFSVERLNFIGFKRNYLEVKASNLKAISMYEKAGFKKLNFKRDYYGRGEDAYSMIA